MSLRKAAGVPLCAVVKADAYGHGSVVVGQYALDLTLDSEAVVAGLAVATVSEALLLRSAGLDREQPWFLLLLGETYTGCEQALIKNQIEVSVGALDRLREFAAVARELQAVCRVHLKVDTGMGRVGFRCDEFVACIEALRSGGYGCACYRERHGLSNDASISCGWTCHLEIEGIYSHCSRADEADLGPTRKQATHFADALNALQLAGIVPRWRHLFNSAFTIQNERVLEGPSFSCLRTQISLARVGISMYGHPPSPEVELGNTTLAPLITWKARITHVKRLLEGERVSYGGLFAAPAGGAVIATVPVGYADGYRRTLGYTEDYSSPGALCPTEQLWYVLIRGSRVPIAGRVCMDMIMLDVSLIEPPPIPGEEVVLLGGMGAECISCEDWAKRLGTINYEITCLIGARVPRAYVSNGSIVSVRTFGGVQGY